MERVNARGGLDRIEHLTGANWPAIRRCWGVLDGTLTGSIWADRATDPRWAVVTELADGTTYIGGTPDAASVEQVFGQLQPASKEIVVGLPTASDPIVDAFPAAPDYEGQAIDFTQRKADAASDAASDGGLPAGYQLAPMDVDLFRRTQWFEDTVLAFGSIERWRDLGLGTCVLHGDLIAAEALAGPAIRGTMEMGIITHPDHRRRGLATAAARHLARACEERGFEVWWNANADNAPSLAVARRIGFTHERPYRLLMWRSDRFR